MSHNISKEREYYTEQISQVESLLKQDPESEDLQQLLKNLKASHDKLLEKEDVQGTLVGKTCEAFFDGKWYNAEAVSVRNDDKGDQKIVVRLLSSDQGREYPLGEVRFLPVATHKQFPLGSRVQAIWATDGLWYNASVSGFTDKGEFAISFDGFEGEPETVRCDRVREPMVFKPKPKLVKEEKTYTTPAGYVIPEKLKIDPAKDTAASIAEKKRKIHHLKSQQRTEKHVEEVSNNKTKWQQFQQKVSRK